MTSATERERTLIRDAREGSEQAMEAIFREHWPMAHRAAYLVTRDRVAAEDIAQEAFMAAIRGLDGFDRRRPFGPWLHRIVVNRSIDWTRARAARRESAVEPGELPDAAVAASEPDPFERRGLLVALAELAPEQRAVVVLRYLFDYSPGEIAGLLDEPRGTVNSRMRRGLDRLAELLGGGDGGSGGGGGDG